LVFLRRNGDPAACLVDLNQPALALHPLPSLDLTAALTEISFNNATATFLSTETSELLKDCFEVLKACEVAGITQRVLEMTIEYVTTREQFGVPVGSFQAIQHKLADAYAKSECLDALSRFAAWSVTCSPDQRPLTARAAIAQACEVGPAVCEACLQAHGGIGFTWEYDLHLFLRRTKTTQAAFLMTEARAQELIQRANAAA
jgi:alkylation response protein AidB-like acyl-CoA dehydrogenase